MVLRAGYSIFLSSIMANPRPHRDVRRPRYLDDFLVNLPPRHHPSLTLHDHSIEGAPAQYPAPIISSTPVRSAPQHLSPEAVMSALQEMKEENNQLRRDMQSLFSFLTLRPAPQSQRFTQKQPVKLEDSAASYMPDIPAARTSTPSHNISAPVDDLPPWPEAPPNPLMSVRMSPLSPPDDWFPPPPPPVSYSPSYEVGFQTTPEYADPYSLSHETPAVEATYRGPKPHIPCLTDDDPRQFARLKMALEIILPRDATERFKYQILVDHLKLEDALLIADSYSNSPTPYSKTMASLTEMYGQPHKLALQRINEVLAEPPIRTGDSRSFRLFGLRVRALVGMLEQLGRDGRAELECGSHTTRLLSKLPHELRAQFKRYIDPIRTPIPTLVHFSDWLEYEVRIQDEDLQPSHSRPFRDDRQKPLKPRQQKPSARSTTVLLGSDPASKSPELSSQVRPQMNTKLEKPKKYCPFCDNIQHYFNQCPEFKKFSTDQRVSWIKSGRRCWRCGRDHLAAQCYLKAKCQQCNQTHLDILHDVNTPTTARSEHPAPVTAQPVTYYLDPDLRSSCVLLKMVKVCLYNGQHRLETYAILDDGSERTILLQSAAQELHLKGQNEGLALRTIHQDVKTVTGQSVSFSISSYTHPQKRFHIHKAFTAAELGLSQHSHPVEALQKTYHHLRGLPLQSFNRAQPLLLIGSDYPHLLTPIEQQFLVHPTSHGHSQRQEPHCF